MPIASMPGYDATHWLRVKNILERGIEAAGYIPRLVSESEEIGVIHGRIVQNLYDDDIVVCDVSGKNANVMFELGMRLAFDKPTIIVKDHETGYSFDTQVIEHINYRQDLRYDDVEEFVAKLASTIKATVAAKSSNADYSPFLSHFAKRLKPKKLETEEVGGLEFVLQKLSELDYKVSSLGAVQRRGAAFAQRDAEASKRLSRIKSDLLAGDFAMFELAVREEVLRIVDQEVPDGYTMDRDALRERVLRIFHGSGLPYSAALIEDLLEKVLAEGAFKGKITNNKNQR